MSRVEIEYRDDISIEKGYKQYFNLPLNKKYSQTLEVDQSYTKNFNPLKYNANMFPKKKEKYRLGNTHYIITINPIKK